MLKVIFSPTHTLKNTFRILLDIFDHSLISNCITTSNVFLKIPSTDEKKIIQEGNQTTSKTKSIPNKKRRNNFFCLRNEIQGRNTHISIESLKRIVTLENEIRKT